MKGVRPIEGIRALREKIRTQIGNTNWEHKLEINVIAIRNEKRTTYFLFRKNAKKRKGTKIDVADATRR